MDRSTDSTSTGRCGDGEVEEGESVVSEQLIRQPDAPCLRDCAVFGGFAGSKARGSRQSVWAWPTVAWPRGCVDARFHLKLKFRSRPTVFRVNTKSVSLAPAPNPKMGLQLHSRGEFLLLSLSRVSRIMTASQAFQNLLDSDAPLSEIRLHHHRLAGQAAPHSARGTTAASCVCARKETLGYIVRTIHGMESSHSAGSTQGRTKHCLTSWYDPQGWFSLS